MLMRRYPSCFDTSSRALRARKRKKSRWNSLPFVRDPIMKNRVIGLLTMLWHFWIDITRPATVEANMAANEITREMPTRFVEFSRMILAKIRFVYSIKVSERWWFFHVNWRRMLQCQTRDSSNFLFLTLSLFFFITVYFINFYSVDKILYRSDCFS